MLLEALALIRQNKNSGEERLFSQSFSSPKILFRIIQLFRFVYGVFQLGDCEAELSQVVSQEGFVCVEVFLGYKLQCESDILQVSFLIEAGEGNVVGLFQKCKVLHNDFKSALEGDGALAECIACYQLVFNSPVEAFVQGIQLVAKVLCFCESSDQDGLACLFFALEAVLHTVGVVAGHDLVYGYVFEGFHVLILYVDVGADPAEFNFNGYVCLDVAYGVSGERALALAVHLNVLDEVALFGDEAEVENVAVNRCYGSNIVDYLAVVGSNDLTAADYVCGNGVVDSEAESGEGQLYEVVGVHGERNRGYCTKALAVNGNIGDYIAGVSLYGEGLGFALCAVDAVCDFIGTANACCDGYAVVAYKVCAGCAAHGAGEVYAAGSAEFAAEAGIFLLAVSAVNKASTFLAAEAGVPAVPAIAGGTVCTAEVGLAAHAAGFAAEANGAAVIAENNAVTVVAAVAIGPVGVRGPAGEYGDVVLAGAAVCGAGNLCQALCAGGAAGSNLAAIASYNAVAVVEAAFAGGFVYSNAGLAVLAAGDNLIVAFASGSAEYDGFAVGAGYGAAAVLAANAVIESELIAGGAVLFAEYIAGAVGALGAAVVVLAANALYDAVAVEAAEAAAEGGIAEPAAVLAVSAADGLLAAAAFRAAANGCLAVSAGYGAEAALAASAGINGGAAGFAVLIAGDETEAVAADIAAVAVSSAFTLYDALAVFAADAGCEVEGAVGAGVVAGLAVAAGHALCAAEVCTAAGAANNAVAVIAADTAIEGICTVVVIGVESIASLAHGAIEHNGAV